MQLDDFSSFGKNFLITKYFTNQENISGEVSRFLQCEASPIDKELEQLLRVSG